MPLSGMTRHLSKVPRINQRWRPQHRFLGQAIIAELKSIVGSKNASGSHAVREQHANDESPYRPAVPDFVVFPGSTEQVSRVVQTCYAHGIPMVPYGSGTGLEGGVQALNGGVCISLERMDKVLEVHSRDFDAIVQPGVIWRTLNKFVNDVGLWFPVDPGADGSLGGMCATSASGSNAVRYGTMRENVLNLEVVLPDGRVINTAGKGHRARKTVAGYSLTNLFVGSEGTLGIITKATLCLHSIPEAIVAATCSFPSVTAAVDTSVELLQNSIPVARIEIADDVSIKACNNFRRTAFPEAPTLFIEFHTTRSSIQEQMNAAFAIARGNGASECQWATDVEERSLLWRARQTLYYAARALRHHTRCLVTDVCVPITCLPELIAETKGDLQECGIMGTIHGHVADGNFHAMLLFDPRHEKEWAIVREIADRMADRALKLDGSCAGEHGIGLGKLELLRKEVGDDGIDVMKGIKKTLDPKNLMNPGKIFL